MKLREAWHWRKREYDGEEPGIGGWMIECPEMVD
jgi:hypothetical protein